MARSSTTRIILLPLMAAGLAILTLATIDRPPGKLLSSTPDLRPAFKRPDWFFTPRSYPLRAVPRGARLRALEALAREERRLADLRVAGRNRLADLQPAWTSLGPQPVALGQTVGTPRGAVSGRVSVVIPAPGYNGAANQTVYLGAAQGGVWRSRDNGATWAPLTDDQPSLALGALAIDPANPQIIYAGTGEAHLVGDSYFGAGLLKSIDGGETWMQIGGPVSVAAPQAPAFLNASFSALAIDPSAPQTIYAATEVGAFASATGFVGDAPLGDRGIWKSTDGGSTWRNVNPIGGPIGGPAGGLADKSGSDLALDPRRPERVLAALRATGIYRSNLGGEPGTWEKAENGLPASGFYRIKLAAGPPLPPSSESTFYAVFATSPSLTSFGALLGIYRSTDGGETWTQTGRPADTSQQLNYDLAFAVDPVDARVAYYGTASNSVGTAGIVWRTLDGGATWTDISRGNGATGGLHVDTHWVAVSAANRDVLFTANDGGVWRTENAMAATVAWTNLNASLSITQFYTLALHPHDPNVLLGGTQDNGTNRYDGASAWFHARGGDGGAVLIDQSDPRVMYHTFFNGNNFGGFQAQIGPEISLDGGATWARRGCFGCTAQAGGFNPADRVAQFAPMALHPAFTGTNGNVVYFGTHRLYRTADRGVTWTGLGASADDFGADLTRRLPPDDFGYSISYLTAIAVHPSLDAGVSPPGETVWVGTGDGLVQRSANAGALGGATFTDVTRAPLPDRYVTDIALDPQDRRRAVVVYSGFNSSTPATPGHVFLTVDQGATWTDISGNLPDLPATSAVIDPLVPDAYYIGTDLGVFRTLDGGATWVRLSNGMPRVAVFALRYHAASRSLMAATHGRGVYRMTLPRAVASVSAASYTGGELADESIAAAFGVNLATATQSSAAVPLPTALAGTSVTVCDRNGEERAAQLFFVSPGQVNYLMPAGLAEGPAVVTVKSGDGMLSIGGVQIGRIAPGLFAANAEGQGVAAAFVLRVRPDGAQLMEPVAVFDTAQNRFVLAPIDFGPIGDRLFLILFGTGIRGVSSLAGVNVRIADEAVEASYAGAQGQFVGLDQINVELRRTLAGRGDVGIDVTVEGRAANPVRVSFR